MLGIQDLTCSPPSVSTQLVVVHTRQSSARQHTYNGRKLWLLHTSLEPARDTRQLLLLLLTNEMSKGTG